jgi:hypothetical protein
MSNENEVKMLSGGDRALSKVSVAYDVGNKGFLTDTEQQMRGMDDDNVGHLTNAKVSAIVNETLGLREKNSRMKMWLGILGAAIVVLGLSNLGTAFAAAWLAKDTTINESTGQLLVKDSDTPVTIQATGQTSTLVLEDSSSSYGCMDRADAAKLWTGLLDGKASAVTIQESSELDADVDPSLQAFFALVLTTNGATWNETMACMPVSNGSGDKVCIDFTDSRCDSTDRTGRALEVMDHHTRRKLFHAVGQGHRGLELAGDVVINVYSDNDILTGKPVDLGSAGDYVILSKTGISTVPDSVITGDIAVSPIGSTAITGFALVLDSTNVFSTSTPQLTGNAFAANYASPTPSLLTTAVGSMLTAYTDAAGRPNADGARINMGGGNLGGAFGGAAFPLTPGVYTFTTGVNIVTDIYFDGMENDDSVFIIQMTGSMVQTANVNVFLTNNAQAKNIFWQVAGTVTVGAGAHMEGILLVKTAVTFVTGSSLNGRILAQTAVALQVATIGLAD